MASYVIVSSTTRLTLGVAFFCLLIGTIFSFVVFLQTEEAKSIASLGAQSTQLTAAGLYNTEIYNTICNWSVVIPELPLLDDNDEGILVGNQFHLDSIGNIQPYWLVSYDRSRISSGNSTIPFIGNASSCTGPISANTYLRSTMNFGLDPSNFGGLTSSFVNSRFDRATEEWDCETGVNVFGVRSPSIVVDGFDSSSPDGKNEVMFGNAGNPSVIAVTIVWINTGTNDIVEWDMLFNEVSHTFGDGDFSGSVMDFEAIAVHELGHSLGLRDQTSGSCSEVTMYAFSSLGETKKRSIESADISGLIDLYGSPSSGSCTDTAAPTGSSANIVHASVWLLVVSCLVAL